MRVFGLTGGIASGKSTVGKMFAALGVPVVDADQIAREVVEPGLPAFNDLVATFGREILDGDGRLDRKKLAGIVFADPEQRRKLNAITHPRIAAQTAARLAELAQAGHAYALYEAALLVENNLHGTFAGMIVVDVDPETQRARVASRDGFIAAEIEQRLQAQAPREAKLKVATYLIDNTGTQDQTRAQVERIHAEILVTA